MMVTVFGMIFVAIGFWLLFGIIAQIVERRTNANPGRPPIFESPEYVDPMPADEVFPSIVNLGFNDPMRYGQLYVKLSGAFYHVTSWRRGDWAAYEVELTDYWVPLRAHDAIWFCQELAR